jgi:uncharacterized membrane protein
MYDKLIAIAGVGTACSAITMAGGIETMNIIYMVLGIIGLCLGIISGVISLIFRIKEALADGKIDKDEAEALAKEIKDFADDVNDDIEDIKEHKNGNRN